VRENPQAQGGQQQSEKRIGNYFVGKNIFNGSPLLGKTIGQGTFGKVRLGTHVLTQEKVAIKILEKDKIKEQADISRVMREIQIIKIVRHPNIV
jgi:serine/threonine protein kinase